VEAPGDTPGEAGFRIPNRTGGFVCGWLLLALLPSPSPPAQEQGHILEKETIGKYPTRPVGDAPAAGAGLDGFTGLGMRAFAPPGFPHAGPDSPDVGEKTREKDANHREGLALPAKGGSHL
jgi:hypothetical protein